MSHILSDLSHMVPLVPSSSSSTAVAMPANILSWWDAASRAYAPESVRAMQGDLKAWQAWCDAHGVAPWPVTLEALLQWLDTFDGAVATLRRRSASLRLIIRASHGKGQDPQGDERYRMAFKAACRRLAGPQKQATAWTWSCSQAEAKAPLAGHQSWLVRMRDQALIRVAYDTLARSSEIRALLVEDVRRQEDGSGAILLRKTKTDQARKGTWRYASRETMHTLDDWLRLAHISTGPLFQGLDQGKTPTGQPLSEMGVWRIFQRAGRRIDQEAFSAHSTRVGAAVDMVAGGLDLPAIMQAGGWKSPEMVARYSANIATSRGAAAQLAKLQNRS